MSFKDELPEIMKTLKKVEKEVFGRRKNRIKTHINDIADDKLQLSLPDKSVTAAVVFGTVCRISDYRQGLAECARVLKKDSVIAITLWAKATRDFKDGQYYFPEARFRDVLNEYFKIEERQVLFEGPERSLILFRGKKK